MVALRVRRLFGELGSGAVIGVSGEYSESDGARTENGFVAEVDEVGEVCSLRGRPSSCLAGTATAGGGCARRLCRVSKSLE